MQSKPNLLDGQMNVTSLITMVYENKSNWTIGESKPNSNPIKPNLRKAKMNVNLTLTKDYRKNDDFIVRINKPNFQNGQNERKLTYNKGLQKKRCFRSPKNKPNSKPVLNAVEWANFFKGQNRLPKNPATPGGVGPGGEQLQLQGRLGNIYTQRALSVFLCV